MSDVIRPIGRVDPPRLRKVERKEKDEKGGKRDWQEALDEGLRRRKEEEEEFREDEEKKRDKKDDRTPPPSRPIAVNPLDLKA